jgi:hypothetical protein
MCLVINNKKIKINKKKNFFDRLKGYMFVFEPIKEGLLFEKCRSIHTFFMYQKIDVIMTDKDNKIIKLYKNLDTEKIVWPQKKGYKVFELPNNSIENLKVGDTIKIID